MWGNAIFSSHLRAPPLHALNIFARFISPQVRYAQRLQIFARMSTFGMRITKLISLGVIFLHWNACAQFLVAVATDFPEGCWVERMGTYVPHSISRSVSKLPCDDMLTHVLDVWAHCRDHRPLHLHAVHLGDVYGQ
jgi:hypothetical protein